MPSPADLTQVSASRAMILNVRNHEAHTKTTSWGVLATQLCDIWGTIEAAIREISQAQRYPTRRGHGRNIGPLPAYLLHWWRYEGHARTQGTHLLRWRRLGFLVMFWNCSKYTSHDVDEVHRVDRAQRSSPWHGRSSRSIFITSVEPMMKMKLYEISQSF